MPQRARKPTLSDSHRPGHMSKNTTKQTAEVCGGATGGQLEGAFWVWVFFRICFLPPLSVCYSKQASVGEVRTEKHAAKEVKKHQERAMLGEAGASLKEWGIGRMAGDKCLD